MDRKIAEILKRDDGAWRFHFEQMIPNMPTCPSECPAPCRDAGVVRGHVARMIREWRAAETRSLDAVAAQLGVSRSTVSHWEHGRRLPTLENIVCLAQLMDIPLCCFFCTVGGDPPAFGPDVDAK